jgi:hypothetical protein
MVQASEPARSSSVLAALARYQELAPVPGYKPGTGAGLESVPF